MLTKNVEVDENGFPLDIPEIYRKFTYSHQAIENTFLTIEQEKDKLGKSAYFNEIRREEQQRRNEKIRKIKQEQRRYSKTEGRYYDLRDQIEDLEQSRL